MSSPSFAYRINDRTSHRNLERKLEALPTIRDHEVLIQVHGVTLNSRDLQICDGWYPLPDVKPDLVPCSDGAGIVVAVGAGVTSIRVGDRVITNFSLDHPYGLAKDTSLSLGGSVDGMLRQYAAMPANSVVKVPEGCKLDFVELASLVVTGTTAWNALYGCVPLRPGQRVLVQGTGGVAIAALQFAKAAGAVTIVTSSSDDKLKFVKEKLDADHTINYSKTPDWAEEALRITNGDGVDYIIENGGAGTIGQSLNAVAPGGTIAVIGYLAPIKQEDMPNVAMEALIKGCIVRGVQVGSHQQTTEMVQFVSRLNVQPHIDRTFGFEPEEVVGAFSYLATSKQVGKVGIAIEHK